MARTKPVKKNDKTMIRQLKQKLLTANHILEREQLATPFGHVSVRIPGTETFLITRSVSPGVATMDDIVVCDMEGKIVQGKFKDTYSEVVIHTGVYKRRKEFNSVIHSHSQYVIALSMAGHTVLPANAQAAVVGLEPIAVFEKMLFIDQPALGEEIAELLGPNKAVLLRGHGAVVVGDRIEDVIMTARMLETSARSQWMARAVGELRLFTDQERQELVEYFRRIDRPGHGSYREWAYYEEVLKRERRLTRK